MPGCTCVYPCVNLCGCASVYSGACEWEGVRAGGLSAGLETGWALLLNCLQADINASRGQQVEKESHCGSVGQGGLWAVPGWP